MFGPIRQMAALGRVCRLRLYLALTCLQISKSQRYRFSLLINELRSDADMTSYLTSVLAFINCLIVSHDSIHDRVRIRNELIGN